MKYWKSDFTPLEAEMDKWGFICDKDTFVNSQNEIARIVSDENHIASGFVNVQTDKFYLFEKPIDLKQ